MEEACFLAPQRRSNIDFNFSLPPKFTDYNINNKDKKILREIARQKAEISSLHVQKGKIDLWKGLNSLKDTRPLVWINDIPWHELNVNDELTNITSTDFSRFLETRLRRTLYQFRYMPADMVVEPTMPCYMIIEDSGFGITGNIDYLQKDKKSDIVSQHYLPQFKTEDDIEKIKDPVVTYDEKSTMEMLYSMQEVFDGILKVQKKAMPGLSLSIWDELIQFYGVQEALTDLALKPEYVHKVLKRFTEAKIAQIETYERNNLLELNNANYRIGSGGLGFTDELPQKDYTEGKVRTIDTWGFGTAQIFDSVSPSMHEEFALQYEIQIMDKFGLNYYGCCEPLHNKIDIISKIPRLRKISISPWADLKMGAEKIGKDYVLSFKPNPSIFVGSNWDIDKARHELKDSLYKMKGCIVEILMKDISTVENNPQKLWNWARVAMEEVNNIS